MELRGFTYRISQLWRRKTSAVPKPSNVDTDSGTPSGSDHSAREQEGYSGKKRVEAALYGKDGQKHEPPEDAGEHPNIDEHA